MPQDPHRLTSRNQVKATWMGWRPALPRTRHACCGRRIPRAAAHQRRSPHPGQAYGCRRAMPCSPSRSAPTRTNARKGSTQASPPRRKLRRLRGQLERSIRELVLSSLAVDGGTVLVPMAAASGALSAADWAWLRETVDSTACGRSSASTRLRRPTAECSKPPSPPAISSLGRGTRSGVPRRSARAGLRRGRCRSHRWCGVRRSGWWRISWRG